MAAIAGARPKGFRLLGLALRSRKAGSMLAFGFSSGLPFALLIGTLTAWLGEAKINLATIGLLSWIGLASAFKFLWSPAVDRLRPPVIGRLGRRKGWIVTCQAVIVVALLGLVATDPVTDIGRFALFAFLGALASATQDIAIDAWRIDVADETTPVEVLSAVYQLGFRTASIVGGAFALHLAVTMSWPGVYTIMAALMGGALLLGLAAPDTPTPPDAAAIEAGELDARTRGIALVVVGLCWAWAIGTLLAFMVSVLATPPAGVKPPSTAEFFEVLRPADRRCDGAGAAGSGGDAQPAKGAGGGAGCAARWPCRVRPPLQSATRPPDRADRAAGLGRVVGDGADPDLSAMLQHLGVVRLSLLSRIHALYEG